MPSGSRRPDRLRVSFDSDIWTEEVERLRETGAMAAAARRARRLIEPGVPREQLRACEATGADGTRLASCLKVYVPIIDGPSSERPFGFVFEITRDDAGFVLRFIAYGERHPQPGIRSVYERAHKRLHGRYPDQES